MTKRDFIAIAFMLAGIYVWAAYGVYTVAVFGQFLYQWPSSTIGASLLAGLLITGVIFLIGYLFIFRAWALASRITPEDAGGEPAFPWKAPDVQAIAISILGLVLGVKALVQLGWVALQFLFAGRDIIGEQRDHFLGYLLRDTFAQTLCLIIGLVLFF